MCRGFPSPIGEGEGARGGKMRTLGILSGLLAAFVLFGCTFHKRVCHEEGNRSQRTECTDIDVE